MGHRDQEGFIHYSQQNGKCELKNVSVINNGIDRKAKNNYWKNEIARHEILEIILHGNAEFYACDVVLKGAMKFEVPSGQLHRNYNARWKNSFSPYKNSSAYVVLALRF